MHRSHLLSFGYRGGLQAKFTSFFGPGVTATVGEEKNSFFFSWDFFWFFLFIFIFLFEIIHFSPIFPAVFQLNSAAASFS